MDDEETSEITPNTAGSVRVQYIYREETDASAVSRTIKGGLGTLLEGWHFPPHFSGRELSWS